MSDLILHLHHDDPGSELGVQASVMSVTGRGQWWSLAASWRPGSANHTAQVGELIILLLELFMDISSKTIKQMLHSLIHCLVAFSASYIMLTWPQNRFKSLTKLLGEDARGRAGAAQAQVKISVDSCISDKNVVMGVGVKISSDMFDHKEQGRKISKPESILILLLDSIL